MKKLFIICLLSTIVFNVKLFSQTVTDLCYDQPISFLSGFDQPTQDEFLIYTDIIVNNSVGALLYWPLSNGHNFLNLTPAQLSRPNGNTLAMSLRQILAPSG